MLNDNFLEEIATKHNRGLQTFSFLLANVLMVVFGVIAFIYLQIIMMMLNSGVETMDIIIAVVQTLLMAALAVLLFFFRDRIRTEYEYTFTNGVMDFAVVYNNKKRKNLGTMNIKNVEALGFVDSGSFQRYLKMPGLKTNNWFVNRDAKLFYFYFNKENTKRMIVIEVSDEMADLLKHYATPGTFQVN